MAKNIEEELEEKSLNKFRLFKEIIQKSEEKGENEFNFKEGKIIKVGHDIIYRAENTDIEFLNGSKIIYFKNENKKFDKKAFFIHDQSSLAEALEKTEISNGILKYENDNLKEKENNDSINSSHSQGSTSSVSSIKSLNINEILTSQYNLIEEPKQVIAKKILTNNVLMIDLK